MSKQVKEQKIVTPTKKNPEQTVVEKVVNQRYTSKNLFKLRRKKRVQSHLVGKAILRGNLGWGAKTELPWENCRIPQALSISDAKEKSPVQNLSWCTHFSIPHETWVCPQTLTKETDPRKARERNTAKIDSKSVSQFKQIKTPSIPSQK